MEKAVQTDQILAIELGDNDSGAKTIGGYLKRLLLVLWEEEEMFDGKRPFGNSSWQYDIYQALVDHQLINGSKTIHEAGTAAEWVEYNNEDTAAGDKIIRDCIEHLLFRDYP